jgi:hypothetical protein
LEDYSWVINFDKKKNTKVWSQYPGSIGDQQRTGKEIKSSIDCWGWSQF